MHTYFFLFSLNNKRRNKNNEIIKWYVIDTFEAKSMFRIVMVIGLKL